MLDIEILDSDLGLRLSLDYASSRYERSTMERFRELVLRITAVLVHADGAEYLTVKGLRDEVQKNHSFFRKVMPTHVPLDNSALEKDSQVLLEQIRTLDKTRLIKKVGKLTQDEMRAINNSLEISLSLVKDV